MKLAKAKPILVILIIAMLAAAICGCGGSSMDNMEDRIPAENTADPTIEGIELLPPEETPPEEEVDLPGSTDTLTTPISPEEFPWPEGMEPAEGPSPSEEPEQKEEPEPQQNPNPVDPQNVTISDKELSCTLSIRCDSLLNNLENLEKGKVPLVPEDGVILAEIQVPFYEGESVFNVLQRETKKNKIHLEFVNTPIYNSAYIEGIYNLYEFDCGSLSGWMYSVNEWFPNYGSSRYQLADGDTIVFHYTCDLGRDIGADYLEGMQKDE